MRTVVLCGSLGTTSAMWNPQVESLRGRFDVVRLEHPGHGGAPLDDVEDVGDLARQALERVDADRFSFVGVSLGGAVGMQIALDGDPRLERLVLACTSARFGEPRGWEQRAAAVRAEGLEPLADLLLERWFGPAFGDVRRFREMFLSTDPEGYARCCDALARWDARGRLARIEAPTLAIAGADDPSTPPEHLRLIASEIPGARLEVIPDGRHLANVERADEFNALLAGFL